MSIFFLKFYLLTFNLSNTGTVPTVLAKSTVVDICSSSLKMCVSKPFFMPHFLQFCKYIRLGPDNKERYFF